jgi:predicted Fe-Mo cluster-binding NifX family protein
MLAIPVDIEYLSARSSHLFGNASVFALYNEKEDSFDFRKNPGCGNGIKTAEALKAWDVKRVVYSFLGDGPFNTMIDSGIDVYHIGKERLPLSGIVKGLKENLFTRVEPSNASKYLDPGTPSGDCRCGCSHG